MPFALLIIGIWLLVSGVRNTAGPSTTPGTLFALIHGDFTGSDNFFYWFAAIVLIGALGYVPKLKPLSTAFLVLLLVVLFLKKGNASGIGGGFFNQLAQGLGTTTAPSATAQLTPSEQIAQDQAALSANQAAQQANIGNILPLGSINY